MRIAKEGEELLKGVFISGTDTGVGKTIVSAVIIRALISRGIKVGAMKPFETGCKRSEHRSQSTEVRNRESDLVPADGMFLRDMAEMYDPLDLIAPVRFEQALAPMVASEVEKKTIELETVFDFYNELSKKYDFMLVEGIGGLLVPLSRPPLPNPACRTYYVTDLIRDLKLPVIIVTRPELGTINHTLLSVNYALKEGLEVLGVIINSPANPGNTIAERTNPEVLKKLCPVPVIGTVPYINPANKANIDMAASTIVRQMSDLVAPAK